MVGHLSQPAAPGRRFGALGLLLILLLAVVSLIVTSALAGSPPDNFCYAVSGRGLTTNQLSLIDKSDFDPQTNEQTLGPTHAIKTDGLALQPESGVLFTINTDVTGPNGYLGTLDPLTGLFTPLPNPLGTGHGSLGDVPLYDVSGLSFDPSSGRLYAIHLRWAFGTDLPDVLFQVDVQTGQVVREAFGPGQDYVVLNPLPAYPHLTDFDGIALDPATGQMYAIVNNSSSGDRLVKVDKFTGAVTDVGPFGIAEVEGLDFDPSGRLWATAGGDALLPNALYAVDPQTGAASAPRFIDNNYNYEGLACMVTEPPAAAASLGQRLYHSVFHR